MKVPTQPRSTPFPYTTLFRSTRHRDVAYVREAFTAGATGYVLKQSSFTQLKDAIRAAARHERYIDEDRKSTRLNSSHVEISYAVFCWKKKRGRIVLICNNWFG